MSSLETLVDGFLVWVAEETGSAENGAVYTGEQIHGIAYDTVDLVGFL